MKRKIVISALVVVAAVCAFAAFWTSGPSSDERYNQARIELNTRCQELSTALNTPDAQAMFAPVQAQGKIAAELEQQYIAAAPGDARKAIALQYAATIAKAKDGIVAYEAAYKPQADAVTQALAQLVSIDSQRFKDDWNDLSRQTDESMKALAPLNDIVDRVSAVVEITSRALDTYMQTHGGSDAGFDDDAAELKAVTTVLDKAASN